jgi:hypothetical protein
MAQCGPAALDWHSAALPYAIFRRATCRQWWRGVARRPSPTLYSVESLVVNGDEE